AKTYLQIFRDAVMLQVKSGIAKAVLEGVRGPFPFPCGDQACQSPYRFGIETQRLPRFSRCGFSTICNDVSSHRRAKFAIALIDVLDGTLAIVAAREVKIDVRPFAAFFRKKSLKQQFHADWIYCSDAQRITDNTISGRPASLYQDSVASAVLDDVPND